MFAGLNSWPMVKEYSREALQKELQEMNQADPRLVSFQGEKHPYEYVYSQWLLQKIYLLESNPSPDLLVAAYCQHLKRWEIPRSKYPQGKSGYLQWRKDLKEFHASESEKILVKHKVPPDQLTQILKIVRKEDNKTNSDTRIMEDALCLVTLEYQLEEFTNGYDDEKLNGLLKKVWKKMSKSGQTLALSGEYPPRVMTILQRCATLQEKGNE